MFLATMKGLVAHKFRLLATALAVSLGVAFLAGTLVFNDTMRATFDRVFANVYAGTDALVREKAAFDGPQNTGAQRGRVDAALLETVRGVDGVAETRGVVLGYARIVGKDGEPLGNPAMGAPALGISWVDSAKLNPFTLAEGRGPVQDDEVVIDKKSADDAGFAVGDEMTVLVQGPPLRVRVVGIARYGGADSPAGATVVLFTPAAAQQRVGEPGKYDWVGVVASPGVSQAELSQRIARVVPSGAEVLTGREVIKETQSDVRKAMSFFSTFMLVFAVIALLVGGFMIFNTFSITVAQRSRQNALLRALGASRRQVLLSVVLEAVVVGLAASVIGLVGGVLVASGLKALLAGFGFDIPAGGMVFTRTTALVCLVVGTVLTVLAAISPARKAAKVPPVEAMRAGVTGSVGYGSRQRVYVGLGLLALGVGGLFAGLFGGMSNALAVVGAGTLLVFFAVSVLARTVSLPLSRVLGWPMAKLRGVTGGLARQNAERNPKRTASSASALMVGVGVVVFMTVLAASTKASVYAAIDRAFVGDYVVDSGAGMSGGVDPGLATRLNALPGVQATGYRAGAFLVGGHVESVIGVDPGTAEDVLAVKPLAGSLRDLGLGQIALYKDAARDHHVAVGDTLSVLFKDSGAQQLRVAAIYGQNSYPAEDYLLGMATYDANFANHFDMQVFVKAAPGAATAETLAAVKAAVAAYPGTKVLDQTGYKHDQAKLVDQVLGLVYGLLALAILIALLGIGNTLALSILERTRELGLLRAVGMSQAQLKATVRWESVIIALQGTLLGLVIGVFFGWALVTALGDQGIDQFTVPAVNLAVVGVLAAVAGIVAAILPGRRAAKLDVLRAVVTE